MTGIPNDGAALSDFYHSVEIKVEKTVLPHNLELSDSNTPATSNTFLKQMVPFLLPESLFYFQLLTSQSFGEIPTSPQAVCSWQVDTRFPSSLVHSSFILW